MSGTNLSGYGVTQAGFVKLRLDQAIGATFNDLEARLGVPLERGANSLIGTLVYVVAERIAALFEMGEGVYNAMYPSSASGVSLDKAVGFAGVTRLPDAYSTAYVTFYGAEQTPLPQGVQISSATSGATFQLDDAITITALAANDVTIGGIIVADMTTYSVTIDGTPYSFTSGVGATLSQIVAGLVSQASRLATVIVSSTGSGLRIYTTQEATHGLLLTPNMVFTQIGSPATVTATEAGPTPVTAGDLTTLGSTISGWTAASNMAAGSAGRYAESDAELRTRYQLGVYRLGAAVQNAIRANLLQLSGVTDVNLLSNGTNATDANGVPAHSVEAIVLGGTDADVGSALLNLVAAGIGTTGGTTLQVLDSEGVAHPIGFTRPTNLYVWLNISIQLETEEIFPINGLSAITTQVVATGNALTTGQDVVLQRFLGPIYSTISGISNIAITAATATDPTVTPQQSAYAPGNIAVAPRQIARFDATRIIVTG